jgi:hypothetical protein
MRASDDNAITVSYGSFSVTLSGHENPFEMLKQITDYYSVLAQTNPNFGAVPAAPPADLIVETVSSAPTTKTPQTPETKTETEISPKKYALQPETTDNLWQEPIPEYHEEPLILKKPVSAEQAGADALVNAADQALEAPEIPPVREAITPRPKSQFLTSNYPFRHFPLRRPGRR